MAQLLSPIPEKVPITDPKSGAITTFFRLRWQELQDRFSQGAAIANESVEDQTATLAAKAVYSPLTQAAYRVSWYLRKTRADGAASTLQMTISYLDKGRALTEIGPVLNVDTDTAHQSGSVLLNCDGDSDINRSVAYTSTTPGQMQFDLRTVVEWFP